MTKEKITVRIADPTYGESVFIARAAMLNAFLGAKELDVTIEVKEEPYDRKYTKTFVTAKYGRHRKTVWHFNGNPEKMKEEAKNELRNSLEDNAKLQFIWCKELGMFEEYDSWDDYKYDNE